MVGGRAEAWGPEPSLNPTSAHHYPLSKRLWSNGRRGASESQVESPAPLRVCCSGRTVVMNEASKKVGRPCLTEEPGVRACVVSAGCRPAPPPRSPSDAQPSLPRSGHACPGPWCWPVGAQDPFIRGAPFQHSVAMPGRKDPRWDLSGGCRGKLLSTSCYTGSANLRLRTARSSAPGERS